jgi:hypothetical protein
MLYREIIAVSSEIQTKHINKFTVWAERGIATIHKVTAGLYCRRSEAIGREKHVASVVVVVVVVAAAAAAAAVVVAAAVVAAAAVVVVVAAAAVAAAAAVVAAAVAVVAAAAVVFLLLFSLLVETVTMRSRLLPLPWQSRSNFDNLPVLYSLRRCVTSLMWFLKMC